MKKTNEIIGFSCSNQVKLSMDDHMKNSLYTNSHSQTGFLNVHGGHYTVTVYKHYVFFLFCNLILEKLPSVA